MAPYASWHLAVLVQMLSCRMFKDSHFFGYSETELNKTLLCSKSCKLLIHGHIITDHLIQLFQSKCFCIALFEDFVIFGSLAIQVNKHFLCSMIHENRSWSTMHHCIQLIFLKCSCVASVKTQFLLVT